MKSTRSLIVARFFSAFIAILMIFSAVAIGEEVTPEKQVAYAGRPSVVMTTSEYAGTLLDDTGSATVYLYPKNASADGIPMQIPQFNYGVFGSGFIVSSEGYIVTNAHVVHTPEDELKADFVLQALLWAVEEWPLIFQLYGDDPYPQTEEDLLYLYDLFMQYDMQYVQEIRVFFGGASGASSLQTGYPAEVRKISPQKLWLGSGNYKYRSGKDLAIIKIEGASNLPTSPLGDSNEVEVGDKVIVIGYPGLTTSWENVVLSSETDYVPTVTSGIISAEKKLPDGSTVFQTDTMIYHGNSGGPAFNKDGEVIGVVTFGSGKILESGEWIDVQGYNFLIPINMAKSFINELNIDTTPSQTTHHFERGLEHYWNNSYSDARSEFNQILVLNPNNFYASEYATMAR
jgi:serine protease Do